MPQEKNIDLIHINKQLSSTGIHSTFTVRESFNTNNELDSLQTVFKAEISEQVQIENSTKAIEGELIILSDDNIRYAIDINGDFILEDNNIERFRINSNGELEYFFY